MPVWLEQKKAAPTSFKDAARRHLMKTTRVETGKVSASCDFQLPKASFGRTGWNDPFLKSFLQRVNFVLIEVRLDHPSAEGLDR